MKVTVRGRGAVNLTQNHFVATGGQASVYVRDGVAYKVYTDPSDTIPDAKFSALSAIADPSVIKPDCMLLGSSNAPIGYTMRAVQGHSLCQLFTRAFRERSGVTVDHIADLAADLRDHVRRVHDAGILIVDLNELNILVDSTFVSAFMIDVDSYQAPGYPATVIMPSVRDYSVHAAAFSELSDWFSYAVLSFQLFVGCHPYKGTHKPSESVPKDKRLEHRMRHGISAFRADVSLPRCCYPVDSIPEAFRGWLDSVLERGRRWAPPDPRELAAAAVVPKKAVPTLTSASLAVDEVLDLGGWQLVSYAESGGKRLCWVTDGKTDRALLDGHAVYAAPTEHGEVLVGFTPKLCQPVAFRRQGDTLRFVDVGRKRQSKVTTHVVELAKSGERFYVRNGPRVLEIEFAELGQSITVTATRQVANVLEMASRLYDGCAIQSMLGSVYVSLFPRSKAGYQVRIPELDRCKVVDARFDGGVLMCLVARGGQYDRFVFRFDSEFTSYDVRTVADVTPSGINFVTLDSGICVVVTEDEQIEAFQSRKDGRGTRVIDDPAIGNDMRLLKINGKVGFERAGKLYQIGIRP